MDATETRSASGRARLFSGAVLVVLILVYVVLMTTRSSGPLGTDGPMIGRRLPYLELEGLAGGATNLSLADLTGHVTLINYWGTWCPPCVRELPEINALGQLFADHDDFRLIAVTCGQGADADLAALRDDTTAFLDARDIKLPVYADHNAASRQAMSLVLGAPLAYPTTLVLDRNGTIRGFWQGYDSRAADEMHQVIAELLRDAR